MHSHMHAAPSGVFREESVIMQEIRFATFNVCNLAPPGAKLYDNLAPLSPEEYDAKATWIARQIDELDADVIGFQEIFSQAALRDVLARTRNYREALHAGFDPDPNATRLTPNVALVSRLPLAAPPAMYANFPADVPCDSGSPDSDRFARAPLHVQVVLPGERIADVFVVHLKSRRPDYRGGDNGEDPLQYAMASLRSLVWRGTEAVALRVLLSKMMRGTRRSRHEERPAGPRDAGVNYTTVHEGHYSTIDHVLVSEEFNGLSPRAIGEVLDVSYFNEHLGTARPEASDHGQVLVRLGLY